MHTYTERWRGYLAYIHAYIHTYIHTQRDGVAIIFGTAEAQTLVSCLAEHSISASVRTLRLSQETDTVISVHENAGKSEEQEKEERFKKRMKNVSLVMLTLQNCIIIGECVRVCVCARVFVVTVPF
jgi:hypothetical protein